MAYKVEPWLGDQATAERNEAFLRRSLDGSDTPISAVKLDNMDECPINCWESSWGERYELYSVISGVAVIPVKGSLSTGWLKPYYFDWGMMGYENIRDAVSRAINDPAVGAILLEINSGGGDSNGCEDLATFLLDARGYKPIISYNAGAMMSAAYWVGSTGLERIGLKTSMSGSIGVKLMHVDRTEQLKMDGIKVTVIRYGDNKALGGPFEPLTPDVKAKLEALAAGMGVVFEESVATNLGITVQQLRHASDGGNEFLGEDSVARGLLTSIGNFEYALSRAVARIIPRSTQNQPWSTNMKPTSTLAGSGATSQLSGQPAPETPPAQPTPPAVETPAPTAEATLQAEVATLKASLETLSTGKLELETKIKDLGAQLESATAHLTVGKEKLAASEKLSADLSAIVTASLKSMSIALGTSAPDFTGADLCSEHARISALYAGKFPIGGVALHGGQGLQKQTETPEPQAAGNVSSLFLVCSQ
jgi:ClpP class serine protease